MCRVQHEALLIGTEEHAGEQGLDHGEALAGGKGTGAERGHLASKHLLEWLDGHTLLSDAQHDVRVVQAVVSPVAPDQIVEVLDGGAAQAHDVARCASILIDAGLWRGVCWT
jgi:hypothetical protein